MHELSIAEALLHAARRSVPDGCALRSVRIRVGPLRGVDPAALEWAWRSTAGSSSAPRLDVTFLDWRMHCPACNTDWGTAELSHQCACGCERAYPVGGNELELESIEVDEIAVSGRINGVETCESPLSKKS